MGKVIILKKKTKPVNFYGFSKLEGEKYFSNINSIILRTNFIGKKEKIKKNTLSDWIIENLKKRTQIKVFKNIYFSPLHTSTLIDIIEKIMFKKIEGVYNLGSKNKISKADFASLLCSKLKYSLSLLKVKKYSSKNLIAKRPSDMSMNIKKFEKNFCIKLPLVKQEVSKLIKEYR